MAQAAAEVEPLEQKGQQQPGEEEGEGEGGRETPIITEFEQPGEPEDERPSTPEPPKTIVTLVGQSAQHTHSLSHTHTDTHTVY